MRTTTRSVLSGLIITLLGAGTAFAQSPIEIADGRSDTPWVDYSDWASRPALVQATGAARAYWQQKDASYEEDLRILAVAEGAFTRPGQAQQAVLYVMSLWPRCCPKTGLALLEGDRLVRNVAFEGVAQGLAAVPGLGDDGRDALVLTGEFGMGGQTSRSMTLLSIGPDGVAERGSTFLYDSDCAASGQSGSIAARVLALPGPTFQVERYTQTDCTSEAWTPDGAAEPLELDPPSETSYADLPVD